MIFKAVVQREKKFSIKVKGLISGVKTAHLEYVDRGDMR